VLGNKACKRPLVQNGVGGGEGDVVRGGVGIVGGIACIPDVKCHK
jgi:hypothetical protein